MSYLLLGNLTEGVAQGGAGVSTTPRKSRHGQADKPFCWCEGLFCRLRSDPTDPSQDQAIERACAAFLKVHGQDPHVARLAFENQREQRLLYPLFDRERRRIWLAALTAALDARGPLS